MQLWLQFRTINFYYIEWCSCSLGSRDRMWSPINWQESKTSNWWSLLILKICWWNCGCFCKGTSMAAPPYQEALDRAGYQHKLEYIEADANACERRSKRKRTLFILTHYNINGGTKIDLELLKIVDSSSPLATPCTGRWTVTIMSRLAKGQMATWMTGQLSTRLLRLQHLDRTPERSHARCRNWGMQ